MPPLAGMLWYSGCVLLPAFITEAVRLLVYIKKGLTAIGKTLFFLVPVHI